MKRRRRSTRSAGPRSWARSSIEVSTCIFVRQECQPERVLCHSIPLPRPRGLFYFQRHGRNARANTSPKRDSAAKGEKEKLSSPKLSSPKTTQNIKSLVLSPPVCAATDRMAACSTNTINDVTGCVNLCSQIAIDTPAPVVSPAKDRDSDSASSMHLLFLLASIDSQQPIQQLIRNARCLRGWTSRL
ncbi:hypothetical protein EJ05DRAFT_226214 [Pseudovirgaria hyperparasitica]|uniref:Uncharacterized protein n=1 Tax=Pseudovirgaria hyperparasitica TaxID=470096 RepID=A0A6A6VTB4_9PEZI|nr:uncharacterized protein EJ05DRAFT_226214 [Pseudovirgaria hyperparasitica]KAF2753119.1 hypothetical protein EJ05DRAFT_226214 [Pseudovirgaria hyperparasitica]